MQLGLWLACASQRLLARGIDRPHLEAQMLAAHVLLVSRAWVIAHPEADLPELASESLLQRREAGEPLAYILGTREFYGRHFVVRSGVLIPRQETELLVEVAASLVSEPAARVLDLGTGSGCIGVTLKLEHPSWQVLCSDLYSAALEVAQENANALGAATEFVRTDLVSGFKSGSFHLVASNPPYVELDADLKAEVRTWEPSTALFAPGDTLSFYRRLATEGQRVLRPDGAMAVEIGFDQGREIDRIFRENHWKALGIWRDLAGIERVIAFSPP